MRYRRK